MAAAKLSFYSSFSRDSERLFSPSDGPFIDSKSKNKHKAMEDGRYGTFYVEDCRFLLRISVDLKLISFALFTRRPGRFSFKILRNCGGKRRVISTENARIRAMVWRTGDTVRYVSEVRVFISDLGRFPSVCLPQRRRSGGGDPLEISGVIHA